MDQFLLTINQWMSQGTTLAALGCFFWGAASVLLSPCHLASIPLMIGYVAGQKTLMTSRKAGLYAAIFTLGLFTTISIMGVASALLGRMLGDIGPWWSVLVGLLLIWVALNMTGMAKCSLSGGLMSRLDVHGHWGALLLGLAYGLLSGVCTFGFIAPILAVVSVQGEMARGMILIASFGLGHCIPIALAGGSAALAQRLLADRALGRGGIGFRRAAGILVGFLGLYFVAKPFIGV